MEIRALWKVMAAIREWCVLDLVVCSFFEHRGMEHEVTSRNKRSFLKTNNYQVIVRLDSNTTISALRLATQGR